jgi:hypothetical protein
MNILSAIRKALTFGRPEDGGNGVRWRWQNLVEGPNGEPRGWAWHGRGWLNFADAASVRVSWNLWSSFVHARFHVDAMEDEVGVSVALAPIALWFAVESRHLRPWMKRLGLRHGEREVSISAHDGTVWWKAWADPSSRSSSAPRWRDGWWSVDDALRGKPVYTSRVISETPAIIPMPERSYRATVVLTEDTWTRSRWPATRVRGATVKMAAGEQIPIPGKGENSWDCDEDAIYSCGTRAGTVSEAIASIVGSALASRERHGGRNWKPEAKPAAATA